MKRWLVAGGLVAVVALGSAGGSGTSLKLALEDRADPNPRQVALGVNIAGACLSLAISWTRHTTSLAL